jgi:hypothetical protein
MCDFPKTRSAMRALYNCLHFSFFLLLTTTFGAQPDLLVWPGSINPKIVTRNFLSNGCDVVEGCAIGGPRRLLAFTTEIRNAGDADLVLGDPIGNPLYQFARCHGHYHFSDFAFYDLLNTSGDSVALRTKAGFCLEDSGRWDINAPTNGVFSCSFQGLQAGWSDFYAAELSCQWIDITSIPPGVYTLQMEVDPANLLPELNETNNITQMFVVIDDPCTNAPPNEAFANAAPLQAHTTTVIGSNSCATRETGEPQHGGNAGGHSIWYRWVADYTGDAMITTEGSSFDTLLAVYLGSSLSSLTSVVSNNNVSLESRWSRVSFRVTNATSYLIAVDGFNGAMGGLALNINPVANDHFTNSLQLAGTHGEMTQINLGSTTEPGEPLSGPHSLWFLWTPSASGPMRLHTRGSSVNTVLAVYTGTTLEDLTPIVISDDAPGSRSSALLFGAMGGSSYYFAVTSSTEGLIALSWEPALAPRFRSITRGSTATYTLAITGQTNDIYLIQRSPDLKDWRDIGIATNLNEAATFGTVDIGSNGFYRAILLP